MNFSECSIAGAVKDLVRLGFVIADQKCSEDGDASCTVSGLLPFVHVRCSGKVVSTETALNEGSHGPLYLAPASNFKAEILAILEMQALELSRPFRKEMAASLPSETLLEIDRLNSTPEYEGCCASHDFIDANMVMDAALRKRGERFQTNHDNYETTALRNRAWSVTREQGFANETSS
ncbi:hypothetical protein PsAD2_03000 [Pseudovibrio axinellae]|uniref:Uncharacterized protein n=1 Tax=Pseudovibrio axinellae TaxID=989403 RepID=A0A165XFR7_9HYPH|nr:hypothetical protein [Pseudovibrio axinellae]KZL17664.1 hypothetical protein PsAD2_03000 [Pseudovibrio axinellae]SER44473.1 hypothetical protein SAMN05421798_11082 [Pseudovibrio axinellae]